MAVRSLLLIAGSLFVMAAAAVLAIAESLPTDNHLSWCGSLLVPNAASSSQVVD